VKKLYLAGILGVISTSGLHAQTLTDLGTLGGRYSEATAVSADGLVIVGVSDITGDGAYHAFKYTGSTMCDLGKV